MPDGVNIPGGPSFVGLPQPPDVPCDPAGDGWRGPQGFPGQTGPQGVPGVPGVPGTGSYSVLDAAFGAVGDGATDDTAAIQAAIYAAAGHGALRIPHTSLGYITGALYLPSNTHLIIEAGATLKLAPGAGTMFIISDAPNSVPAVGASNVYIELRGTLDGNSSSVPPPGFPSGGIANQGVCSDIYIDGFQQGLITNVAQWPINLSRCTNGEIRNLAMTNSGNTSGFAGIATSPKPDIDPAAYGGTGVSYNSTTGAVSLTTTTAHPVVPGATFTVSRVLGSTLAFHLNGEWIAAAGTGGLVVNFTAQTGLGTLSITSGKVTTTTKCYNVGITNCYVKDIRDLGIALYGGCERSYIRGCWLDNASAQIYLDDSQPGINADCEISGCFRYNGIGPIATSSNTSNINNRNCRVFNNTVQNVHDAGITIGSVDYCEVYGNLVHDTGVNFNGASGQCGQLSIAGSTHVNCYGNTVRNPTVPGYWHLYASSTIGNNPPTIPAPTYSPTTGAVSLTTTAAHTVNVGDQFVLNSATGSGACTSLNGTWTATAGTTGATLNFTGPTGLALTLKGGAIRKYTPAVAATITSGTYDPATGNVSLTTSAAHALTFSATPQPFVVSGITGTGPMANLNGYQVATTGTSGTTINCTIATGFAAMTITGGTILPANFGISVYDTDYCRVTNNFVGDWQATRNMAACIGGQWGAAGAPGTDGYTEGNVYGPKLASGPLYSFPADAMVYVPASGCTQGVSYDSALDFYCGTTAGRNIGGETFFPSRGLTVGWNTAGGAGEVDLMCGQGAGTRGGFNFRQVTNDGTINANVGVAGSLLANDGYGNTRLGGALVHGAMQTVASLANAGTVTVNAGTSMVLIRNAASIATASVVLPAPVLNAYTAGAELELNFQNPIGALTVTAASGATVINPPTAIAVAGASANFVNSGSIWLRRIAI